MTKDYLARQFKNYHEITGDVVTPEMFGAKGDGVTDDTNAVSQALNSGSVVYIPKGKYLVSWGKININDSTKDIIIYGDGEDSILLFNPLHKNPDTGKAAHGFMIRNRENSSNRVNISIHDIQIRYENSDTSITYPSDEARLFGCVGYFKNIILDHVYMHDSVTTSTTPKDSLMWLQVDADNVIVSNSKFENFTNNTVGGCVWMNSGYFGVNYHINNISIINNILRNTNQDEAIAIWALPEGLLDVDTIMIDGNEIVHKNWNGECIASYSVIGIATLSGGSITNKNYMISNNTIVDAKISQGVIRNIGVDKLSILGNTITILGADSNATTIDLIENYKNAYSVIKDNHIEIVGVTKKLILFSQQGNIDYINNVFETSNNVQLASYGDDNYDVQKVLNFIGNTMVFRTPTASLFEINNHGIWLTMNVVDNKVNGGLRLIANSTQNTNVQNNIFNIDNGVSTVALEVSKVLSFIDNENIVLEINNTNISTKLTAFKYSGLKSGLIFKVDGSIVDDSPEVRETFFVNSDIIYTTYTAGNGIDITNNTVSLNSATQSILNGLGTASTKNSTDRVSPNNTALVESQSVYSAINTALSSIYTPRGNITCAELTSALLISDNIGNVYETSDSGTTTALFLQGAGHPITVGSNVGIINAGESRILFNLMANAFDLTSYQKKDLTNAVEGETTVEGALGALSTNKQPKTLDTPITIDGTSQTTVEGALGALNRQTNFADNPIGTILPYGGSTVPTGWLLCDGSAVSRTTYSELFAVIGTNFGAGDGSTTFNLPDMRESVPKGAGLTGHTVGAHLDADGLAVGEFLDDRVQEHIHSITLAHATGTTSTWGLLNQNDYGNTGRTGFNSERSGATTEVKSVGVNYIIKAKMVAVPADFMSAVEEAVEDMVTKVHFPWNATDNTDAPTITIAVPAGKCLSGTFYFHNSNSQVNNITAYSEQVSDGYQIARVLGGQGALSLSITYVNDTNASVNIYIQAKYTNVSLNAYCYNYTLS